MESVIKELERLINNKEINPELFLENIKGYDIFIILKESKVIKDYLCTFLKKDTYKEEELLNKYGEEFGDILIILATLLNKIKEEKIYDYGKDIKNLSSESLFFASIKDIPILNKEVTIEYIKLYQEYKKKGDNKYIYYQKKIIEGNIRLVMSIAYKFKNRGLEVTELISEGSMGIIKAIKNYNPNLGYAFSTYATWWIRQAITRAIQEQSRTIRITSHQHTFYSKMGTKKNELVTLLGREPSIKELAEYMEVSERKINDTIRTFTQVQSLDAPISDEENENTNFYNYFGTTEFEGEYIDKEFLKTLFIPLNKREEEVIKLRYFKNYTLEEVGHELNLTRERIRQIEAIAFKKMRKFSTVKYISLSDIIKYPKEEIVKNISKLSVSEQNYLYKLFGYSLSKRILEKSMDKKLRDIINKLQGYYVNGLTGNLIYKDFQNKTLMEIYENIRSYEELKECLDYTWLNLKENSKIYNLLHRVFGNNGTNKCNFNDLSMEDIDYVCEYLYRLYQKLKTEEFILRVKKSKYERFNNKSIYEMCELKEDELKDILNIIGHSSKFVYLIFKIFGIDLSKKLDLREVSFLEIDYVYKYLILLSVSYKSNSIFAKKTLKKIIGFDIPNEYKNNNLLKKAFGEDLSLIYLDNLNDLEKNDLMVLIKKIKYIYKVESEEEKLMRLIKSVPFKYQEVLELYLIEKYCAEDIALALHLRLCVVNELLREGLKYLKKEEHQITRQRTKNMI